MRSTSQNLAPALAKPIRMTVPTALYGDGRRFPAPVLRPSAISGLQSIRKKREKEKKRNNRCDIATDWARSNPGLFYIGGNYEY